MPKPIHNYTLAFISRNGKEFVEQLPEEAYPDIVRDQGKISKKDQAQRLCLIRGSDGLVLAQWQALFYIEYKLSDANRGKPIPLAPATKDSPVPSDTTERHRRTGPTPDSAPAPAEDPVEKAKLKGRKARAEMEIGEAMDSPGWPTPQPASDIDLDL